ncbi:probable Ufm1-specific protease 2 [Episyrphus balteatus]|uniref:probable Ufm1-specific protease 2 n=1 Tax=Episyrphus balteatus TaxID=286459 RepID=UPI00248688F4|nr:probable Ufm1-specific protease 2 [Episyrphus balteatus]
MNPKLKISCFLLKRLERIKQQSSGCLFGVLYGEGTLLLLGFNIESTIGQLNYKHIQYKFPAELDLCGLVKFGDCTDAEAHINVILKDVDITDNPILLQLELGTLVGMKASIFMHEKLEQIPYEVMEAEELYTDFCFSRIKCNLMLYTESTVEAVKKNMHILRKNVAGGSTAFHVKKTKVYLTGAGSYPAGQDVTAESSISSIVQMVSRNNDEVDDKTTTKKSIKEPSIPTEFSVITIDVLKNKTKERPDKNAPPPAAGSMYLNRDEKKIAIPLNVEAMAILYKKTKLTRFYDILIESICRSLRLFEYAITEPLEVGQAPTIPRCFHFFPPEFGHFLTYVYPEGISEDETNMQQQRKKLHYHFGLPISRPYFRRANCHLFRDELDPKEPLLNTHIGLRPSGVKEGRQYLVQGNYSYYHYMQQDMRDNGWGCAYRSLQTLCSWFRWQGYTERSPPTHLEIQKYLVRIGDKPQSFVGSSQWIGSTEVSMCLQGFLNVDSKIQYCSSGADLGTMGSDLAMHFQSQGSPIMIGGGVLAHTILGIDYNSQTGQIKFLILDPHYTGTDDLATIQAKGWCGWKGVDFWDKKSYYNMCMPQRPIIY